MYILSIDVGIKNCAYVIGLVNDGDFVGIVKWDIINLVHDPKISANNIDFVTLSKNLKHEFGEHFGDYNENCDELEIIIENQIGQNAVRMKAVQGMITQWFVDNGFNNVKYISSAHKLNHIMKENNFVSEKKLSYAEKKKMSIQIVCNAIDCNDGINEWRDKFAVSKKKDDLSDCFLQMYYFMKKNDMINNKLNINLKL